LLPLLWLLAAKKRKRQLLHQHLWLHLRQLLHQLRLTPLHRLLRLPLLLPHLLLLARWTPLATLPKKQLTQLKMP
jgi:hypothetical protein